MKFKGKKAFPALLIGVCIPVILVGCSHSKKIDAPVSVKSITSQIASSVPSSSAQENSHTVIDQTTLAASSTLTLNQTVKTTRFTVCVPKSWGWRDLGDTATPMLYFNMKSNTDFGGIIYMAGYVSNESGQDTDFADYAIRSILLPNHLAVDPKEYQLTGLFTDAYLLKVDQGKPTTSGDTTITHWTYIFLVDENQTTATKFSTYVLAFNTYFASEADVAKIAGSFKLL